ncbi:hypothetical protein PENOC_100510 [Penicillium occitanis (nom. inval.)]|nr:hypothetical protein PENOC_100510 [Penicillium occitanis (nom. inval.)]
MKVALALLELYGPDLVRADIGYQLFQVSSNTRVNYIVYMKRTPARLISFHKRVTLSIDAEDPKSSGVDTSEQGAATIVWAAVSKDFEKTGGKYLEDAQIAKPWSPDWATGYTPHAYSIEKDRRLWVLSSELVQLDE